MPSLRLNEDCSIGSESDPIFIIAEIGQNHQGCLDTAKRMIAEAKRIGCDCVKFQKSHLPTKFTKSALDRLYDGPNSWGKTYGAHKIYLEFSLKDFKELQTFANEQGILFSASAMDENSFDLLVSMNLPFIKIGSGDANNFALLKKAAMLHTPLIISTGMQTMATVTRIVEIMQTCGKKNFALLHCVSAYPTKPDDSTLDMIRLLKQTFPDIVIGYSGHEEGVMLSQAAVVLGAAVIERHFTLDINQKGSDHSCSLLPEDFEILIHKIREMEFDDMVKADILRALHVNRSLKKAFVPVESKIILPCEMNCRTKLGKSLVYAGNFSTGHCMTRNDILVKVSEPFGITAENIDQYVNRTLTKIVKSDTNLQEDDF